MSTATLQERGMRAARTRDGKTFSLAYLVTGLAGATAAHKMDDAFSATGLPALGDAYPGLTDVVAVSYDVTPADKADAVVVVVDYERPSRPSDHPKMDTTGVVTMDSSLSMETTREDKDGTALAVTWSGDLSNIYQDFPLGTLISKSEKVEVELARPQFTFELLIRDTGASRITDAQTEQTTYTGAVNDATWGVFAARTVLCTGIRVTEPTPEEIHKAYQFEYRAATWDVTHLVRVYGRIPDNIDTPAGNGIGVFNMFEEADFSLLPVSVA